MYSDLSIDEIRSKLCVEPSQPGDHIVDPGVNLPAEMKFRDAAVLVPIVCIDKKWHILLTERTEMVQDHKNQVSFPGGAVEPDDRDRSATALREAWEEIGLQESDVSILGYLPNYPTVSGFIITPVVGLIPWPYDFRLSIAEVKRVFTIPLDWLADPANHEEREFVSLNNIRRKALFFKEYDGEILWGISARIALEFVKTIFNNQ